MKVKKLNLWDINRHSNKLNVNLTSVLSSRASIRSSHADLQYSSKESSVERQSGSPCRIKFLHRNAGTVNNMKLRNSVEDLKYLKPSSPKYKKKLFKSLKNRMSGNRKEK